MVPSSSLLLLLEEQGHCEVVCLDDFQELALDQQVLEELVVYGTDVMDQIHLLPLQLQVRNQIEIVRGVMEATRIEAWAVEAVPVPPLVVIGVVVWEESHRLHLIRHFVDC